MAVSREPRDANGVYRRDKGHLTRVAELSKARGDKLESPLFAGVSLSLERVIES